MVIVCDKKANYLEIQRMLETHWPSKRNVPTCWPLKWRIVLKQKKQSVYSSFYNYMQIRSWLLRNCKEKIYLWTQLTDFL